jgi:CubicO group peptidase (beta-lactamase class C family)
LKFRRLSSLLFSLCTVCQSLSAYAQNPEPERPAQKKPAEKKPAENPAADSFASALEQIRSKHKLPGLIAGQFDTQKIRDIQAVGFRRSGSTDPLALEHPMHLGSCTKSMTATMVAMAVDQGLLSWQTTLGEVFAKDPKVTDSPWANVSIEQLVHHTSGAPANPPWNQFADPKTPTTSHRRNAMHWWMDQSRDTAEDTPTAKKSEAPKFLYSNLGYMALGAVLEEIRQEAWEDQIQKRLFDPLEMKSAGFGIPSKSLGDRVPWGHKRAAGLLVAVEQDNPPALGPAGTVYANMEDWIRYLQVHLRSKAADSPAIQLAETSFQALHQPEDQQEYAGGWFVIRRNWSKGPIYTHNGSNTVWYCVVFLAPTEGRGIFAASNLGLDAAGPCDEALQWILKNLSF